jgi:hypothetical protein
MNHKRSGRVSGHGFTGCKIARLWLHRLRNNPALYRGTASQVRNNPALYQGTASAVPKIQQTNRGFSPCRPEPALAVWAHPDPVSPHWFVPRNKLRYSPVKCPLCTHDRAHAPGSPCWESSASPSCLLPASYRRLITTHPDSPTTTARSAPPLITSSRSPLPSIWSWPAVP